MLRFLVPLYLLVFLTAEMQAQKIGSMKDPRDNSSYSTIEINQQQWTTEPMHWHTEQSYCCFDSTPLCKEYGRLYSWQAAQKACPVGYRLPSAVDYKNLVDVFKNKEAFVSASKEGWKIKPAGHKTSFGVYYDFGFYAHFWTSDAKELNATAFEINFLSYRTYFSDFGKDVSLSVICIKN